MTNLPTAKSIPSASGSQTAPRSSNESVTELRLHFQRFLSTELNQGTFTQNGERTTIKFQASKSKIQILEKVIQVTQQMTARLN